MKLGDKVEIRADPLKKKYRVSRISGKYYKLTPKSKGICCNYFFEHELIKLEK